MGVGQGSYFKGWSSTLPTAKSTSRGTSKNEVLIGHVLDIDYNDEPGKIRVRLIGHSNEANDDNVKVYAYPIDQNMVKYPIPGEMVVIVSFLRNLVKDERFVLDYYYVSTVTSNQNITFNSDPYVNQGVLSKQSGQTFTPEYQHRFEKLFKSILSFFRGDTLKTAAQLKPYEGDYLVQGRFGSTMRLGSTDQSVDANEWSVKGGVAGNPIMVLSADRSPINESVITENVNESDSSVYICTSQAVPVELSTSAKLRSHLFNFDIKGIVTNNTDLTNFLSSPEELSKPWQYAGSGTTDFSNTSGGDVQGIGTGGTRAGGSGGGNITTPLIPSAPTKQEGVTNTKYTLGSIIISIPKGTATKYPLLVVFGGISYANSEWMYKQMNGTMLSKYIVVSANYTDTYAGIKPIFDKFIAQQGKTYSTISTAGFSGGGLPTFNSYSTSFAKVYLIDPSTRDSFANINFSNNCIMIFNPRNWTGNLKRLGDLQPKIGSAIAAKGGIIENINMSHAQIPTYVFNKFIT